MKTKSYTKFLRNIDYFGIVPDLRIKSNVKYRSKMGGLVFLFWGVAVLGFLAYSFRSWVEKENMNVISSNEVIIPSPRLNLTEQNFMIALGIRYDDGSLATDDLIPYFEYRFKYTTLQNSTKTDITLPQDFKVIPQLEVDRLNLRLAQCPNTTDFALQGLFTDPIFIYGKIEILARSSIMNNKTNYDYINNLSITNPLTATLYFIDTSIKINDLDNPIKYYVNSWFSYIDMSYVKRMNLDFMKTPFEDDGSIFFNSRVTNHIMKYHSSKEYGFNLFDRVGSKSPDNKKLVTFYLRSYENIWTIKREFQKLTMFLASVSSIASGSLIILFQFMTMVNKFKLDQSLISKTVFFKEKLFSNNKIKSRLTIMSGDYQKLQQSKVSGMNNNYVNDKLTVKKDFTDKSQSIYGLTQNIPIIPMNRPEVKKSKFKKLGACEYLMNIICCIGKKNINSKAFDKGKDKLDYYRDVLTIVKKLQEVDIIKRLLCSKDQICLIDFLSKPIISLGDPNGNGENEIDYNSLLMRENHITSDELEKVYIIYKDLMAKGDLSTTDKLLVNIFEEKLNKLL